MKTCAQVAKELVQQIIEHKLDELDSRSIKNMFVNCADFPKEARKFRIYEHSGELKAHEIFSTASIIKYKKDIPSFVCEVVESI